MRPSLLLEVELRRPPPLRASRTALTVLPNPRVARETDRTILVERGFNHPITLTSLHLLFQTLATRVLHRSTTLISGPVPHDEYAAVPMSEQGAEQPAAASGERADVDRWKAKSVEMDWVTWRRQMCVADSLSLALPPLQLRRRRSREGGLEEEVQR